MLTWTIKTAIISLVIIMILHNIYIYMKDNLTTPSVTDYINRPNEKYEEICNIISNTQNVESSTSSNMKEELKLYLQQQLYDNNSNDLSPLNIYTDKKTHT